jgi:hypothetical protein
MCRPVFPVAEYTIARNFMLPASVYIATALAGLTFIFPESLNHVWLSSLLDGFLTVGCLASNKHLLICDF